jgi:hypothetical protein
MQFCVTRVILRDLAALVRQIFHSLHKITHFLTGYINSYYITLQHFFHPFLFRYQQATISYAVTCGVSLFTTHLSTSSFASSSLRLDCFTLLLMVSICKSPCSFMKLIFFKTQNTYSLSFGSSTVSLLRSFAIDPCDTPVVILHFALWIFICLLSSSVVVWSDYVKKSDNSNHETNYLTGSRCQKHN